MDTKTSSVNTSTNSPVAVSSEKYGLDTSGQESKKWLTWAGISALTALLAFSFLIYNLFNNNHTASGAGNLGALNQGVSSNLNSVLYAPDSNAFEKGFTGLNSSVTAIKSAINDPAVSAQAPDFVKDWSANQQKLDFVLKNKDTLAQSNAAMLKIAEGVPKVQQQYRALVEKMLTTNATPNQVAIANNQIWLAEKINNDIMQLRSGQITDVKTLTQDVQQFGATLAGQQTGTQAIQQVTNPVLAQELAAIKQTYEANLGQPATQLMDSADVTNQVRQQAAALQDYTNKNSSNLATIGATQPAANNLLYLWLPALLILSGFLAALYFLNRQLQARTEAQRKLGERETLRQRHEMEVESERARRIQEENERNQMAILRLLDELGDLAEGDLTVNATVSEDFTGAIADSVNFAIDQLRQLVSAINVTAERVARASDQTQATAVELAEASESQAQEIAGASAAINEMAVSIDQVSSNAAESAAVADRSVAIAYNGAEVVQRTIDGMNTIRDQIQETSKRIKRLGESSQEIGDIVGLINDIADQTNILALNAAIQASMAGEAGRGFAVVADEVQRLAERSATATKQIETLVKTIQADTNEAVMSMESTTAEVVRGAKLAKDAGEALDEVQTVSNNLAELIQSISNAARQQAASAGHVSNTMNIIQDITSQTTSGTLAAARSIGQLNEMAAALQESVSGFKLPDEEFVH